MIDELYEATKHLPYFTVENFRKLGLHNKMHPNAIGQFFKNLSQTGKAVACGMTRATHPAANSRWVFKWRWV